MVFDEASKSALKEIPEHSWVGKKLSFTGLYSVQWDPKTDICGLNHYFKIFVKNTSMLTTCKPPCMSVVLVINPRASCMPNVY